MSKNILRASNIRKRYKIGSKWNEILKGVDLAIEKGTFVSIIGPSGSGKSTLLYILGLMEEKDEGKLYLENIDIDKINKRKKAWLRNNKIGFVFQFFSLFNEFNLLENVLLPCKGFSSKREKEYAKELLEIVGLIDYYKKRPWQLSAGELQRIAIARALIKRPSLILCDEPTGNLDTNNTNEIVALLQKISKLGNTVVLVTHNLEITKHTDKTYVLSNGRLKLVNKKN